MSKKCDLHTHSIFSDGTYTPEEIIDSAINLGLSAVALCDHNTIDGLSDFLSAAAEKDIDAIAGTEFSVDYNGTELHLLALFIPKSQFSKVSDLMKEVNSRKEQSNIGLISALNKAGYNISFDTIKNSTPNGKFNRAHIAAELTKQGYTNSIKQAFDTLLSPDAGYYKEPKRLSFLDMISFIKSIGAVPVLAHPFLNLSEQELEALLPLAKELGVTVDEILRGEFIVSETEVSTAKEVCSEYEGKSKKIQKQNTLLNYKGIKKQLIRDSFVVLPTLALICVWLYLGFNPNIDLTPNADYQTSFIVNLFIPLIIIGFAQIIYAFFLITDSIRMSGKKWYTKLLICIGIYYAVVHLFFAVYIYRLVRFFLYLYHVKQRDNLKQFSGE